MSAKTNVENVHWIRSALLSKKEIEIAMEKSPTGGNAKPFFWLWKKEVLVIHHHDELADHYLNRNFHASWFALGCLLASIDLAAEAQGWCTSVRILDDMGAEVTFAWTGPNPEQNTLIQKLVSRSTYRGKFRPSEPPSVPQQVNSDIQVRLQSCQSLLKEFKQYILTSDTYLWLQKKASLSFFREVRFFDTRVEPRGIRSMDLGIGRADQLMMYILSFFPWLPSILVRIPGLGFSFHQASKRSLQNAHFLLISARSLDPQSLVRAGQAAMRTWISLEAQGYQAQPYSIASLTAVAAKTGHLPEDTLKKFIELFESKAPRLFQRQFDLQPGEMPVWLFRVGKAA